MSKIKENIASNILEIRKIKGLTQAELGEKLNYTDKTVSKWERGESTPDIETIAQMAELFDIPFDYFFRDNSETALSMEKKEREELGKKIAKMGLGVSTVWLLGTAIFVYAIINGNPFNGVWLAFVWPLPLSALLVSVLARIMRLNKQIIPISLSVALWTLLTAVFLTFLVLNENFWIIYLVGIPIQLIIIITYWINKK